MQSISDILNSMVQPTEQNSLFGSNPLSTPGSDSSVGSFNDVFSRLTSQNSPMSNETPDTANPVANSNPSNTGSTDFSNNSISITEVQVSETVQADNANSTTLKNIENTVASVASALAQLVQMASHLQNFNPTQAQNMLVAASGGTISNSQAQELVTQIANLKNENNGQNALNLTPNQQNALLAQMMQSMLQNQQITLTSPAGSQNNSGALSGGLQGSSILQFNFGGSSNTQNGNNLNQSLSIDIQTFNLQTNGSHSASQGLSANTGSENLTDATTQRLSQLLQQLNVAPSETPVNIQVQSSVAVTNSPELAKNFQNLVQILTQAGAGQAVLNTYLTQSKNDLANHNLQSMLNQPAQVQNNSSIQSVSVTPTDSTQSANGSVVSNQGQTLSAFNQAQLLNDSLGHSNIQMSAENAATSSLNAPPLANSSISNNQESKSNVVLQNTSVLSGQPLFTEAMEGAPQTLSVERNNNNSQGTPTTLNNAVLQESSLNALEQNTSVQPVHNPSSLVSSANELAAFQNEQAQATPHQPQMVTSTLNNPGTQEPLNTTSPSFSLQFVNNQGQAVALGGNTPIENEQVQATPHQPSMTASVTNVATSNEQAQVASPQPPFGLPGVNRGDQNNQGQPVMSAVTFAEESVSVTFAQNQSATNMANEGNSSQSQVVFADGQLEALNGIVARFNSGVVTASGGNANTLNENNTTFANPLGIPVTNQAIPTQNNSQLQNIIPTNVNSVIANQNIQPANNLANDNAQNQLIQPTSFTTQQMTNNINASTPNVFVPTAANATVNNGVITSGATTGLIPNTTATANVNPAQLVTPATPVNSQVVTNNQVTVPVVSSASNNPPSTSPVVTQPVTNPASLTAQNLSAATVIGEVAKTAVPPSTPPNASNANNAPAVTSNAVVSAVQPVTAQAISQPATNTETSTNLNTAGNQKDSLSNTTDLQNLMAAVNVGVATATDKTSSFQSAVDSIVNNNPNGSMNSAQILSQIASQVASQTADAKMVSRLNFQLIPESLGHVTVQVALVDQSISARIIVSNPDVHEVLQQNMVDLKAALNQAGLQVDQMQVQVQGGGANMLAQYYQYQQEGNSYRESAWSPALTASQTPATDNSPVFSPTRSNTLLNLLV